MYNKSFFLPFCDKLFFPFKGTSLTHTHPWIIVTKRVIIWTIEMTENTWIVYHILFIVIFLIDNNNKKKKKTEDMRGERIRDTVLSLPATWPYTVKSNPSQIWPRQSNWIHIQAQITNKKECNELMDGPNDWTNSWLTD